MSDGSLELVNDANAARPAHGPLTRRWTEQRWLLDNIIRSVGMDWDQPRSIYLSVPCGPEANADFAALRQRITKLADASPAFEAVARRREAKARAAEESQGFVTARENYFMASIHWGAAQWPIDENNEQNRLYNDRKRECYTKYARLADHHVEAAWIRLPDGRSLPAWLHLPPGHRGERVPVVISLPGMDSFKEMGVAMYGDRWLSRGLAVLALDGPGQYESPVLDIYFSMPAWIATGTAAVDWLLARAEIDPDRIGLAGNSFGSFFGTIAAAHEPRIRAVAVSAVCHEPGFHTIFEEASPTFKMRFMYMSGITDEARFDELRPSMTWEGHAARIRSACPSHVMLGRSSSKRASSVRPDMYMKRILNVGDASSKIVWKPGSWQTAETATARMRGPCAAAIVPKNEPKLLPARPMRLASISARAESQSTAAVPVAIHAGMLK